LKVLNGNLLITFIILLVPTEGALFYSVSAH
jgi:hypothetical protein